ncbi:MAG TPA: aminotransferase class III-fold pyridoxal phosphate-dependent enzyme [Actinomycetota bacterium]|nr:aminotransferase class III-fold pyridoxal phosphate-dependent enzyme [Actinomycetota bacterium]
MTTPGALLVPDADERYPTIVRGDGVYLVDDAGNRYLDACSGAIAANIGHGRHDVAAAMADQAARVAFLYRTQFVSSATTALAEQLARRAPGDLDHVLFTNSGSEATEAAIRIVIRYWQARGRPSKTKVVGRDMSYHGVTAAALSATGHTGRRSNYTSLLADWPRAVAPYCYRCPVGLVPETCGGACAHDFERVFGDAGPDTVAAAIVEPVVGAAGGALAPPVGYLRRLRDACDRHDVLLIADEIMTGLGRTGTWFGCDAEGVVPDVMTIGKGVSAGYAPIAAVLMRRHVVDAIGPRCGSEVFGHTYSGNPVGAAAAGAVLDALENEGLVDAARSTGARLEEGLRRLARTHRIVGDVRGRGLLLGVELVADRATRTPFAPEDGVTRRLVGACFDEGLVVYPAATGACVDAILVAPPLTITPDEIVDLLQRLDRALAVVEALATGAPTDAQEEGERAAHIG